MTGETLAVEVAYDGSDGEQSERLEIEGRELVIAVERRSP